MRDKILYGLAMLFIMAGPTLGGTTRYEFVEAQSTVLQTGGFAGVHITYSVAGQFVLTVDFNAGVASFDAVDANLSEIGLSYTQSLNELFNMTELVGTVISDTQIHFVGKNTDIVPIDVNLMVILADGSVVLTGGTEPPCCDFFIYDLDAVAVMSTRTIYVDADANGLNNGTSWANAYNYLQDALMMASAGNEICVAQGTYKPDEFVLSRRPNLGRMETFQLKNGVAIKGGYAGFGEPDTNARDIETFETILSGDLNANDPEVEDACDLITDPCRADNCYNVVTGSLDGATAVLDGFTITGGNANWQGPYDHRMRGGGMSCSAGRSSTVTNCLFHGNSAIWGGGMYIGDSSPILTNCTFRANAAERHAGAIEIDGAYMPITNNAFIGNFAGVNGGAVWNFDGAPVYVNCIFSGNTAGEDGGAMWNVDSGGYTLINCTLANNTAAGRGGAIDSDEWPILTNCILWSNRDGSGMGESAHVYAYYGPPAINYSCVQGWTGDLGGTGNIGDNPRFAEPAFLAGDDYHLKSQAGRWEPSTKTWVQDDVTSPCIDAGDPMDPIGLEPFPNGGRVNMGAFGGTAEASKSYFGRPVCEIIVAGDVNGDCLVNYLDFRLMALHWLEDNNPP
jgi:hypothetical protein